MDKMSEKKQSENLVEAENTFTNQPISIDELQTLKFENAKLKIDMLNTNKTMIEKEINVMSQEINKDIQQYMEDMKIPNHYRLDFSTMQFIVVTN